MIPPPPPLQRVPGAVPHELPNDTILSKINNAFQEKATIYIYLSISSRLHHLSSCAISRPRSQILVRDHRSLHLMIFLTFSMPLFLITLLILLSSPNNSLPSGKYYFHPSHFHAHFIGFPEPLALLLMSLNSSKLSIPFHPIVSPKYSHFLT